MRQNPVATGTLARDAYRRAANNGDLDGQRELARCYYFGIGTTRNLSKAVEWYKKAAERGDADAQYAVGRANELGEGVKKNINEALRWYEIAAKQGDEQAKKAMADLRESLERHGPASLTGRIEDGNGIGKQRNRKIGQSDSRRN